MSEVKDISPGQVRAVNVCLGVRGLIDDKEEIISSFTNGRTEHISEMKMHEARMLLMAYNKPEKSNHLMLRKIIAMAHELNWITKVPKVDPGGNIVEGNDYSVLYNWVKGKGYLKKELREYSYNEMPRLVTQFENVYKFYLSKR